MNNQSQHDDFNESDHENQIYTIHYIQQIRIRRQNLQFLVKWKKYKKNQSTWEDNNNFTIDNDWCIQRHLRNYTYWQLQKLQQKQNSEPINGYSYSYDRNILDIGVFEQKQSGVDKIINEQNNQQNQPSSRNLCQVNSFTQYDDKFDFRLESNQELIQQKEYGQFKSQQRQQNILDTQISHSQKQQYIQNSDGSSQESNQSLQNQFLRRSELQFKRSQQLNQQIEQLGLQQIQQSILQRQKQSLENQLEQDSNQLFIQDLKELLAKQQGQQVQQNLNNNDDIFRAQICNDQDGQQIVDKSLQQFVHVNQFDQCLNNHQIITQEPKQQQIQISNHNQKKRTQFDNTEVIEYEYIIIEDSVEQIIQSKQKSIQLSEEEVSQKQHCIKRQNNELKKLSNSMKINKVINRRISKIKKQKTDQQIYEQLKLKSFRDELRTKYQTQLIKMNDSLVNFIGLQPTYKRREEYGQIPTNKVSQIIQHASYLKNVKVTKEIKMILVFQVKFEDPKLKNNYFKIYELFKHERELLKQYILDNQCELGFLIEMFNQYYKQKTELYDSLQITLPDSDRIN